MARVREDDLLSPSVFDRLIVDEADDRGNKSRDYLLYELKENVRRDLQNLLNTRWRCEVWPPDYEELELSVVNYGIPDFTGVSMGGPDNQKRLLDIVKQAISTFEPRLAEFELIPIKNRNEFDRTSRFKIEGMLHAEPAPEPVTYDTQMIVNSSEFEIS